jgi:hypothetical protein
MDFKNFLQNLKSFFVTKRPLPSGFFAYQTPPDLDDQYRLHLRIEKDGTGILVINASTVLHLNQMAVENAYYMIKSWDVDEAVEEITRRYRVDSKQARYDYEEFVEKVETLIKTPDLDPVTYLDIDRQEPYSSEISAPYRLDCAVTYKVRRDDSHSSAPIERVDRELSTEEWKSIIHKAYDNGIPHILFTGGEPTLREDLPELLQEAEDLGLVTGVLTDGLDLIDDSYRTDLLQRGLDHLLVILDPENDQQWDSLGKVLPEDVFTAVHLTLQHGSDLKETIRRLAEMGANALSLSTTDSTLSDELKTLRDFAAMLQLDLVWDIPVPYSKNNPVSFELENADSQEVLEGAGKAWLYIEPDGDVLPAQGIHEHILGNILRDSWEDLWEKT